MLASRTCKLCHAVPVNMVFTDNSLTGDTVVYDTKWACNGALSMGESLLHQTFRAASLDNTCSAVAEMLCLCAIDSNTLIKFAARTTSQCARAALTNSAVHEFHAACCVAKHWGNQDDVGSQQ